MKAKILVILPTSNFLHRQILEGILDYARENGPWRNGDARHAATDRQTT